MSTSITCDLRPLLGVVRDQGTRPTCLAFAASDAHAMLTQPFDPFSVEYLYYHAIQEMPGKDPKEGIGLTAAAKALSNNGQPLEAHWVYQMSLPLDLSAWTPPSGCPLFYGALNGKTLSFDQIRASIEGGQTVILGLRISEHFHTPDNDGIIRHTSGDPDTGSHAVLAVGHGKTDKESCILVRNSWGTGWAIGGHAFIEQTYLKIHLIRTALITQL